MACFKSGVMRTMTGLHMPTPPHTSPTATPMIAQYLAIKAEAPGCLLFYRMGDFYELFFEDAAQAAATLDIALTRRGQHEGADIPMCGVPVHAAETYLARLIRGGHRVAIAEQIEEPAEARKRGGKSVVARAIVRVVTPGTLTEDALLDTRASNYLAAIAEVAGAIGLAWCDISTGGFHLMALDPFALDAELARLDPAELLVAEGGLGPASATRLARERFDSAKGAERLKRLFGVATLDGFGSIGRAEAAAAGALISYLDETGKAALPRLQPPRVHAVGGTMLIDAATRASLELTRSSSGGRVGSLLDCIDRTVTGAGARLLADDLAAPLTDAARTGARLDMVSWFVADPIARTRTRDALKRAPDLERALGRLAVGRGGPRDLAMVRDGLSCAVALQAQLRQAVLAPDFLSATLDGIGAHGADIDALTRALVAEPPVDVAAGGFIAPGYDEGLDALRSAATDGRRLIAALEARYRDATGLTGLKIRHNNVLGYHVEVTARHGDQLMQADSGFVHRQTLAGVVRFGSVELGELAAKIAHAHDHALAAEAAHFEALRVAVLDRTAAIQTTAAALARLDVGAGLAELAATEGWSRPTVDASCAFQVERGRHPVVEAALRQDRAAFVGNDCDLGGTSRLWLVTGPNMAGKSTFLRQNALLAILAQSGSFVPAAAAHIGIVDKLFSRVGAADNLAQGRSTFMVEMVETAAILSQATAASLVILDEVGRGTSTYDGLAIAWAVLEAVHDTLACRCLFATHYHELTRLSARLPNLSLQTVKVREYKGELVFLHELAPGAADRSYGLAVARLAGLPPAVLARAAEVLKRLEVGKATTGGIAAGLDDLPLFAAASPPEPTTDPLRERLSVITPDSLTPRAALDLLYELKGLGEA